MKPHLVIVGIGNPGKQYEHTRHNVGFQALGELSTAFATGEWKEAPKFLSRTREARLVTAAILLVEPQTFVNRTGEAIRKIIDFYKLDPATQLLVISDDIDLPAGDLRLRLKGGPGTHNGLRSIVASIGENFPRLRIGVGMPAPGNDLANWVLSVPSPEERDALTKTLREIPERVKSFILERFPDAEA